MSVFFRIIRALCLCTPLLMSCAYSENADKNNSQKVSSVISDVFFNEKSYMNQTFIILNDGNRIPQFGIGVYQVPKEETARVVKDALLMGVRHIDTAHAYQNEREVGDGIVQSGVPRSEIFTCVLQQQE